MQLKLIVAIVVITLVTEISARIVCPEDYCAKHVCALLERSDCELKNDGIFVERGGWCACCPTCLTKIREGQSCWSLLLIGAPPTATCDVGLVCDRNTQTCVKQTIE